jgi:glycosyltransferase involved in cell wall biosynthesis
VRKLCINGKFFCQRITGTQRYARELLKQFDTLLSAGNGPSIAMEVLVPRSARSIPRYANLQVRTVGTMSGTWWEQLDLPRYCRGELLLTLSGGAPILHSRNVITIHDAAVFAASGAYSPAYRLWYQKLYRRMARKAEHIFTVSNFSKAEIVKWCAAAPEKISVTYLGSEHFSNLEADPSVLPRFGISGRYVLAVGSQNPNKNFQRTAQAVSRLSKKGIGVVVAGGSDHRIFRRSLDLPEGVRVLGYVSDAELKALYQNAACFVFASLYEGFGLSPLEAISSGCPVVVSRAASLPELYDGAAVFCDPCRPDDIAAAVEHVLQSPPATADGLKAFASKFSWKKCARETLEVLDNLV